MLPTFTQPRRLSPAFRYWLTAVLLTLGVLGSGRLYAYDVTVAKDGTGNFTTVQAAIDAAPTGRTAVYTIFIKNGRYKEKITVPSTKPFLQFVGESVANTILTFNSGASDPVTGGGTVGTQNSASISINATDFSALNVTFENSYGDGTQAVAVLLNADRCAFYNCRFLGNQDTLYTKGSGTPHHYFKNCYIDGNIDFIFGSSAAVFDNCVVYAKTRTTSGVSYITAANTPPGQAYGYVFRNATLPANTGGTQYYLGRPWQNSTGNSPLANNKVVFLKARLGAGLIRPEGWVIWDSGTNTSLITDAEYNSRTFTAGKAASISQRVSWSKQLTPADTAFYSTANALSPWDPCTVTGICATGPADIAVSNFRATKGAAQATLDWNISWAMSQIKYELFRSSDNVNFTKINEQTATTDSLVNFQATDALPVSGTAYYYYLKASKAGFATHTTETIQVSSIQTLSVTGTLGAFTQYQATPSAVQTYTLSGVNLTDNVTVTPPAGYEVSANGGTNWYSATTPLVLAPTSNTLAATAISVRLNAATTGTYAGNIANTSPGATAVPVAVTGTRVSTTAPVSNPLQWWPMKVNNQDSTAVRNAGVTASTSTLRNLYVSNGTTVSSIRAYSNTYGQAFGTTANGDGSWGTASGGPGGNLNRRFSEQFTVTAAAGQTIRLDSLVLTSAFNNTSSNTKLAVVWSRSGFVSDSADVVGGRGPSGGLLSTANGAFATPILLANQTTGPTNVYRLSFAGTPGVTLTAGQTLTIRLYFACGSSSAGRYALLKNVYVTGENTTPAACNAAFSYAASAFCKSGTNPTPTVTGTAGGTFSAPAGLSLNATTGAINLAASTAGTYTVTYTTSGSCTGTTSVTITNPAVANIGYAATSYCTSATSPVAVILGTGSTAGTFTSSAPGLTLNATTGAITPSTSTPGTYFVTNTVAAAGGCAAATGSTTVTITAAPVASFSYASATYCVSGTTNPAPVVPATSTAGTFSAPAGLVINATTGVITLASSTPGTYTVTNSVAAASGCAATAATATVTITAAPVASFSYANAAYCVGSANPAPVVPATSTAGTFSSTTGLVISATGVLNLATSTPGTYTVTNTVAASGGCASVTATATVTINARPATPTLSVQYNGATTTLTSSAATGNQFYLNNVLIPGATGQTYVVNTPAQFGTYSVVVTNPTTGCASLPSATLTVTTARTPLAGSALRVFPNPTHDGKLSVELSGYVKAVELTVLNALGQPVFSAAVPAAAGKTIQAVDLSQLPAGLYILRAKTDGGLDTRRIIKE